MHKIVFTLLRGAKKRYLRLGIKADYQRAQEWQFYYCYCLSKTLIRVLLFVLGLGNDVWSIKENFFYDLCYIFINECVWKVFF